MFFPPVIVTTPSKEATELKDGLKDVFGDFTVTHILPAADKVVLYLEFKNGVTQSEETETMRDILKTTGEMKFKERFHMKLQLF
jgi:hypothetical protein